MSSSSNSVAGRSGAELNARLLKPLAQFSAEKLPSGTFEEICGRSGLEPVALLRDSNAWVSHEQFEAFLAGVRGALPDDAAFMEASVYRLEDGYGPLRFLLWATSPGTIFALATRTMSVVSAISRYEVLESTRTQLRVRYKTTRPESRLMCLSRQAAGAQLPTMWGLPRAVYAETTCVSRGDDCCEYDIRWADRPRWLPALAGAATGAATVAGLAALHHLDVTALVAVPLLGGLLGYAYELKRAGRGNLAMREEQNEALRQLAVEEADARRELIALGARQRDWTRLLEEVAGERTNAMSRVVDQLERLHEARDITLRGFSHDLRNPLAVLRVNVALLREGQEGVGDERDAFVQDLESAIEQMRGLLEELMNVATPTAKSIELAPEPMDVALIVDRLRRRLRALVHGRDIRVSVFRTREAPDAIETNPLLLDRIIDNLLTNAAKYTERGSIVIEVDGSPSTITLKVSDTGRGIQPDALERTFEPGGSDARTRATDSYGVGLSVVVQLLSQVGGRLEVMSKPNSGTTFWVHLPIRPEVQSAPPRLTPTSDRHRSAMNKVVTIRRLGVGT